MIGRSCQLGAARHGTGFDLQPQAEHFVEFRARERSHLKAAIREYVDQSFGLQLHQRFAYRDLAGAEFGGKAVLTKRRPRRVRTRENAVAESHDQLAGHRLNQRFGHARMPQQTGSSGSSRSTFSPVTCAVPVMEGTISPLSRSCQRKLASKVLPIKLSCIQTAPSASLPSAARQASLALVPVPHGDRSYALPGQSTKFRLWPPGRSAGPKTST